MTDKSAICVVHEGTKSYDCGGDVGPEGQAGGHPWDVTLRFETGNL